MIVKNFNYISLIDEDNTTLHEEILAIPEPVYKQFQGIIEAKDRAEPATEGMIKNLVRSGATRIDGENGEAAITVKHFNDEATLQLYRAGAELDAHDAPLTIMEKHYKDGKPHYTIGYDHSGMPTNITFKDDVKSHFIGNLSPIKTLDNVKEIVGNRIDPARSPRAGISPASAA